MAARGGALYLRYLDESGMSTIPSIQRAWSPAGHPHTADASVAKKRLNIVGALDPVSQVLTHAEFERSINRADVVEFIDQLATQGVHDKPTLLVLDNASIHRRIDEEKIYEWGRRHRLFLFYLPAYSPELNLIEILWKHAKYYWRDFVSWAKEDLLANVHDLLSGYGRKFEIHYA